MTNKWLPLGSVVVLEGGNKQLMIYGRLQRENEKDTLWDYVGCPFPEGNIGPEHTYIFNKEQIERVFFLGYQPLEEIDFADNLDAIKAEQSTGQSPDEQ